LRRRHHVNQPQRCTVGQIVIMWFEPPEVPWITTD
jgi:hypothetical protein